MKAVKKRKCGEKAEGCHGDYTPWTAHIQRHKCCQNPKCLFSKADKNRVKRETREAKNGRALTRQQKQDAKTIKELLNDAQVYCNRYIMIVKKGQLCCTCGKPKEGMQAGHFIHAGSGANWTIRFHHDNINPQCLYCNMYRAGSSAIHREFIIENSGAEILEYLENHPKYSFTRADAIDIKHHFMDLIKQFKAENL